VAHARRGGGGEVNVPDLRAADTRSRATAEGLLAEWSVFIDFDGTISREDVGIHLLDRFVAGRYETIDARYEDGTIGSRQYVRELWGVLAGVDRGELLRAAREVPLDPGLDPLLAFLDAGGAEVSVISDGLGFYVHDLLAGRHVTVRANQVDDLDRPGFPFADPSCPCGLCGTCKASPLRDARRRGRRTAIVGDGTSDRFAVGEAELVFAKGRLVDWCTKDSVPYLAFEGLADVLGAFRELSAGRHGRRPARPAAAGRRRGDSPGTSGPGRSGPDLRDR